VKAEVPEILKSFFGFFLEAVENDSLQRWNRGVVSRQFRRFVMQNRIERVAGRDPPERRYPREHFVQDNAEAEDVGPMVDAKAARLFRRHVGHCAHHGWRHAGHR
jgi:hypothetical protein